jgi:hypothetical protein
VKHATVWGKGNYRNERAVIGPCKLSRPGWSIGPRSRDEKARDLPLTRKKIKDAIDA